MFQHGRLEIQVYVDASLPGMGAWWENNAYVMSRHLSAKWRLSITQLEMLNVLVLFRTFGCMWVSQDNHVHIDNQAVVHALNHGKTRQVYTKCCKIYLANSCIQRHSSKL